MDKKYIELYTAVNYFINHRRLAIHKVDIVAALSNMATSDVREVVHGKWEHIGCGVFQCDQCGERISLNVYTDDKASDIFKFCPNCGAEMEAAK